MTARSWFYGPRGFGSPSPMFDSVEIIPAHRSDLVSEALADGEQEWACPNCGSTTGQPVSVQGRICAETGYDDSGEACTECVRSK